jgi:RND family efflux transporter MFP subunit
MKFNSSVAMFTLGAGLFAVAVLPRIEKQMRTRAVVHAAVQSLPLVAVARAEAAPETAALSLPATTEANFSAQIHSRANGYVTRRLVDIGDTVRAGQLLASVESPEVMQELAQARAALAQVQANYESSHASINQAIASREQSRANQAIAQTTFDRWDRLVQRGVLPRQEGDEKRSVLSARNAELAAAEAGIANANAASRAWNANISAQQANVRRLRQLASFQSIVAPFDGVVTERNVEKGDLVSAGSLGAPPLFVISQSSALRVKVNVPQTYAAQIRTGQSATITVAELPGEKFSGRIVREAGALNTANRTLQTEVQIDNQAGRLRPGLYAQVQLGIARLQPTILVPADTIYTDAQGARIATLSPEGKVKFASIQAGRNLGEKVEVLQGLSANTTIIRNPADSLRDGMAVQVQK